MADTIRGDGLFTAHNALTALVQDQQRLDRARERFSQSPPSYRSYPSGTPTRSQSPNPPSEEEQVREARKWQLKREYKSSMPYNQFHDQVRDERRCILETRHPNLSDHASWLPGPNTGKCAVENVKRRWIEQGIWKDEWNSDDEPGGRWKHEEPLGLESESETDSEAEPKLTPILGMRRQEAKSRRPKSDDEMRRIAARRIIRHREREASRPYHQFIYQLSEARQRIQDKSRVGRASPDDSADINTKAYDKVKDAWIKRGLWDRRWGVLPGMSWKHEHPFEELMANDAAFVQANRLVENSHREADVQEAPPRRSFPEPSQAPAPVARQKLPTPTDPASLHNGNQGPSPRAPRTRCRRTPSAAVQRPVLGGGETSGVRASLGPVNPPKVSKSPSIDSRRRPKPSGLGIPHQPSPTTGVPPRRSKRLQEKNHGTAIDPTGCANGYALKGTAVGGPKSGGSSKPRGISKTRRSTTKRRTSR
ncbi:hypothetical protein HIM_10618 [Hirsutella minnesotensis 3608]|uniref:Uncharacterized protein n=1 Tax=Hirsutella minnesotensis 3608 TaxID=1043627 RepID=A0A0F7ZFZ3_9HYPO|nr:hypothetical protein HIM_10618 [Hirsutella minnesotensis 3608]